MLTALGIGKKELPSLMCCNSFVSRIGDPQFAPNILALLTTLGIAKKELPSLMRCDSFVSRIGDCDFAPNILALLGGRAQKEGRRSVR
jgi:hypothetical protein